MSIVVLFDMLAGTALVVLVCASGAVAFAPSLPSPGIGVALALAVALVAIIGGALAMPRLAVRLRALRHAIAQGGAILRTPRRYARGVAFVQAVAWICRITVVFLLLEAFGLPASLPAAGTVMVVAGLSTLVPLTPGGAGTQQVMLAAALHQTVAAAAAVSFAIGMQAGVTVVNACLGIVAAMIAFRTVRPFAAVRSGLGLAWKTE
jgi:uncharacterized membrane protein YbhN (UPF0104 family)